MSSISNTMRDTAQNAMDAGQEAGQAASAGARRSVSIAGRAVTTTVTPRTSTNCTRHRASTASLTVRDASLFTTRSTVPSWSG